MAQDWALQRMKNLFNLKDWREDWKRSQDDVCLIYWQRTGTRLKQYKLSRWEKANDIPVGERRLFFDAFSEDGIAILDLWPEIEGLI